MAKRYTDDFKFQAVQQYQKGAPAATLCQQLGIARSTLFLWAKQHSQIKLTIFQENNIYCKKKWNVSEQKMLFSDPAAVPQHLH